MVVAQRLGFPTVRSHFPHSVLLAVAYMAGTPPLLSVNWQTLAKTGSRSVHLLMSCSERESTCEHSNTRMVSPGSGTSPGAIGSGK